MSMVNFYNWDKSEGSEVEIEDISCDGSEIELIEWIGDKSENLVITVPTVWEICGECRGAGTSLCDGLRGVAISGEEMARDWNEDERFAYFSGGYDTQCESCSGTGKIKVAVQLTEDNGAPDWFIKLVEEYYKDECYFRAEQEAERRMGC